jgi:pentatricopeptide repeat protein
MQVDEACRRWRRPDAGIWEARQAPMHYVSSKILAWVAIDRGIRIAEEEALDADVAHWRAEREAIIDDVLAQGLDPEGGGFSRAYGQPAPDASNLLAVLTHFVNADDPRMRRTIQIIEEQLAVGDLVYRYRQPDGLPGDEGAFLVASFWLIDVYLSQGRLDEARDRFERMLDRASPLGLYAEEMDPRTGAFLGNYPQALTHLGLINVAVNLARAGVGRVPPMPEERLDGVIGADRWP